MKEYNKIFKHFQIVNKCRAHLKLHIKKLFELQGTIVPVPLVEEKPSELSKRSKSPKKEKKKEPKLKPTKKFTTELSVDEIHSLSPDLKLFTKVEGKYKIIIMSLIKT